MTISAKKHQFGFTLIELIVAMGVTATILAGAMLAFKDATTANQTVDLKSDMTDNLRAGANLIEQDLIQTATGIPTGGISIPSFPPDGSACGSNIYSTLNRPAPTTTKFPHCNVVLPAIEPGPALGPAITGAGVSSAPNSDITTIMYADNTLSLDASPINSTACPAGSITQTGNAATFDTNCVNLATAQIQVNSGDLIMFSNAKGNALQVVTSVNGQTLNFAPGDAFGLNGTNAPQGTILQLRNSDGSYPPTTATRIWMITYYLDDQTDPVHVRLVRRVNFNTGVPVGETIDTLQFTYNFVDGISNPSNQSGVPTANNENQIRSVACVLGTRSDGVSLQTNQYLRNNFQMLVSLRSMAYVNRYR
jgi:prepilin-type N-terminal cleavage/methylation domain-containing protein